MAAGRALLSGATAPLKVWYHNGEENMGRAVPPRSLRCVEYYGVDMADLEGWLCMTNPQKFRCGWRNGVR